MQAGKSDEEIRQFMVARYGDFVLYSPPVKSTTVLLWVGPFVLLVLAALFLTLYLRRRQRALPAGTISDDERARARSLLGDSKGEEQ